MPLRPDFSEHRPDPRLDGYRDRIGRLSRGDEQVGAVLVRVVPYAEAVGGHAWWTRWGPSRDVLWLWTLIGDRFEESYVQDGTEDELATYDEGRLLWRGEELGVVWLNAEESARERAALFDA